jgi:hypothetical protein
VKGGGKEGFEDSSNPFDLNLQQDKPLRSRLYWTPLCTSFRVYDVEPVLPPPPTPPAPDFPITPSDACSGVIKAYQRWFRGLLWQFRQELYYNEQLQNGGQVQAAKLAKS